jgi:nitroreductase
MTISKDLYIFISLFFCLSWGKMKEMNRVVFRKYVACIIALSFLILIFTPIISSRVETDFTQKKSFELPGHLDLDIILEEAICRRMSVREFTKEGITNEELSTILWHAYGKTKGGTRNIHGITNEYPITIYVLARCGVWRYNPEDHNLIKYRRFDMTWIGQYDTATVKIALVWDKNKCSNENYAGAEIGEICQNIYFTCNALNLGTVTTASEVNQLYFIGLPINEKPRIIMPIGHPITPYQFTYDPIISNLPSINDSTTSLTEAVIYRNETIAWEDADITLQQQTQVIWSSYGYSYFIDEINDKRHKTLPSSHGSYPLTIYCVNKTGIYRYQSESHQLIEIKTGDYREEIASASENFIISAPLIIIPVLNITGKSGKYLWVWYYEAAASAYNVLLESTAWNLSSNIILNTDTVGLTSILELSSEKWLPMFIIPVGKQKNIENQPPTIIIEQPLKGLYLLGNKIMNLSRTWIIGPLRAEIQSEDDRCFKAVNFFIDGKAVEYSNNLTSFFFLPGHLLLRRKELTVKAYDYEGKSSVASIKYFKIF